MFDLIPFDHSDRTIFHDLDHLEKSFFGKLSGGFSHFRTDIIDKGDKYLLKAELPGFDKKDIKININENYLTISAEHNEEKEEDLVKNSNFIRRERRYGSFTRSFDISDIDIPNIKASYNNGILDLELPKTSPKPSSPSRNIEIQ